MRNKRIFILYRYVRILWILHLLDIDRCSELVYVTNTTVEEKVRFLMILTNINQSDLRSFREISFHQ